MLKSRSLAINDFPTDRPTPFLPIVSLPFSAGGGIRA